MLGDSPPFSSRVRAYVWLSVLILVQRVCYQASPWSSSSSSSLCYLIIITIIIIVWHCFFSSLFLIKPLRKHEFYSLSCCYSVFWCRHLNKGKRRWPISSVIIAIITNTQIGFSRNDDNVFPSQTHKRARTRTRTHKHTHTRSTPTHFYFASSFVFNSTF